MNSWDIHEWVLRISSRLNVYNMAIICFYFDCNFKVSLESYVRSKMVLKIIKVILFMALIMYYNI